MGVGGRGLSKKEFINMDNSVGLWEVRERGGWRWKSV